MTDRYALDADRRLLRVGGVAFPVISSEVTDHDLPSTGDGVRIRRARVVFENRWQLSVVWGFGTYSDNHFCWDAEQFVEEPATVEVMVVAPDCEFAYGGEPLAYVTPEEFRALAEAVRDLPHDAPASAAPVTTWVYPDGLVRLWQTR